VANSEGHLLVPPADFTIFTLTAVHPLEAIYTTTQDVVVADNRQQPLLISFLVDTEQWSHTQKPERATVQILHI